MTSTNIDQLKSNCDMPSNKSNQEGPNIVDLTKQEAAQTLIDKIMFNSLNKLTLNGKDCPSVLYNNYRIDGINQFFGFKFQLPNPGKLYREGRDIDGANDQESVYFDFEMYRSTADLADEICKSEENSNTNII